jgi:hypothetical protein
MWINQALSASDLYGFIKVDDPGVITLWEDCEKPLDVRATVMQLVAAMGKNINKNF